MWDIRYKVTRSRYAGSMSMVRVSVTLEESVAHAARESAKRRGISLSAWMREAVHKELAMPQMRLEKHNGRLVATTDLEMPVITADIVRETLDEVRGISLGPELSDALSDDDARMLDAAAALTGEALP